MYIFRLLHINNVNAIIFNSNPDQGSPESKLPTPRKEARPMLQLGQPVRKAPTIPPNRP
ncbi:MAG: hypothetical protein LBD75_02900 [Candidatus Peribacteria bacterium]|nr:hypothetical protein [Candidatus Peribacteria bacterium]